MRARIALVALLVCVVAPLRAHTLSVGHVDIAESAGGQSKIEVDLAVRDLALALPLDANNDRAVTWGEVRAARPALDALVAEGIVLRNGGAACTLSPEALGIRRYDGAAYVSLRLAARCPASDALELEYRLLFAQNPAHRAIVTWRRGDQVVTDIARDDARRVEASAGAGPLWRTTVVRFVREGVAHILDGLDHLAFLLCLLLPAVLTRSDRSWQPQQRFVQSLKWVAVIVTAFTVAHSITLSLVALGVITPSQRLVEVVIAASVLLAALNNIRPIAVRRVWLVASVFGLVHGMGFASALKELGLPRGQELASLFGFNLGVELGQLAVVVLILPAIWSVHRRRWYARIAMPGISALIAISAIYWIWQRLAG